MKSILIKDTTREEREQIVQEGLCGDCAGCDACGSMGGGRVDDIYRPYINGEMELAEINRRFNAFIIK